MKDKHNKTLTNDFYEMVKEEARKRVGSKRFKHVENVAETAVFLAREYGVDERKARLAGILHDWDKSYNDEEIRQRVHELNLSVDAEMLHEMPRLLHGPTAAAALKRDYPSIDQDVLSSIARHTTGSTNMTKLDMVIFVADVIEPSRPYKGVKEIREAVGKVGLDVVFLMALRFTITSVVDRCLNMHPDTITVWNYYIDQVGKKIPRRLR